MIDYSGDLAEAKNRCRNMMKAFEMKQSEIDRILEDFDIFTLLHKIEIVMYGIRFAKISSPAKYLSDSLYLGWKKPQWFVVDPDSYAECIKYLKWVILEDGL